LWFWETLTVFLHFTNVECRKAKSGAKGYLRVPWLELFETYKFSKVLAMIGIRTTALQGLTLKIKGMIQDAI